jgi:hypothetical protein
MLGPSLTPMATATACQGSSEHGIERPSMSHLRRAFQQARRVRREELLSGRWVEITNVMTERFVNGHAGPDHVQFDVRGIRRADVPGHPLDWTMTFRVTRSGALQVAFETAWDGGGDVAPVRVASNGEVTFEKEYGGEGRWIYRCRAASATHLVCLLRGHKSGHGMEFLKIGE